MYIAEVFTPDTHELIATLSVIDYQTMADNVALYTQAGFDCTWFNTENPEEGEVR